MKAPISFALCIAFTFAAHQDATAQRRRAPAAGRPAAVAAAAAIAPRPAWTISEQPYNEDGESTTLVSLQPMPLGAAAGAKYTLSFGLGLTYEGKSSANFKNVSLNIFARSPECWFPAEQGLTLTPDGRPMTLAYRPDAKGVDGVWWVEAEMGSDPCNDTLVAYISPATLSRLSKAKTLTGKIGEQTFQFTAANLDALRAFVAKVALPQLAPPVARPRARP